VSQQQLFSEPIREVYDKSGLPLPWSKWTSAICVCFNCGAVHPDWAFSRGSIPIHGEGCTGRDWVIFNDKGENCESD